MKAFLHSLPIALLAAAAVPAFAAPTAAPAAPVLRDLASSYMMSSGRKLEVSPSGGALRVRYGRLPAKTLRYDGQGSFVSNDGQWVLQFDLDRLGDVQQVRLTMPADQL